ncbi:unnamed protein product [Orchesella dallaii]|uniref:Uncharacterized protein n=1 Tax=Orchesella dallaii TaxID=48710 RepID=A0ABP1R9P3_9HEXA
MEGIGVKRNNFSFDLSLAIRKHDVVSVLKLQRDLGKLKPQNESSSKDVKACTSGGDTSRLYMLHAKVDKLFKNLDEFRKQLTRVTAALMEISGKCHLQLSQLQDFNTVATKPLSQWQRRRQRSLQV